MDRARRPRPGPDAGAPARARRRGRCAPGSARTSALAGTRRVAAALEPRAGAPDRVARHWAAAGEPERAAAIARAAVGRSARAGRHPARVRVLTARPLAGPADGELYEEAAVTAARIGEYEAMQRWIAAAERCYRAAGRADRAVRMRLDPAFDYLPVRRSAAIRDEPVERLLVDAQTAMVAGDTRDRARVRDDCDRHRPRARRRHGARSRRAHGDARARRVRARRGDARRGADLRGRRAQPGRESRVLTIRGVARFARGYRSRRSRSCGARSRSAARTPTRSRWTGQIALANALLLTGQIDEGIAAMKGRWATCRRPRRCTRSSTAIARSSAATSEDGLAALAAGTRRAARPSSTSIHWGARSPPRTCSTSARCARSTAGARTRRCRRSRGSTRSP